MPSSPFLRALLSGAAVALVAVAAWFLLIRTTPEESAPPPPGRFDPAHFVQPRQALDAPYVATDYEVVDAMLALAKVRPDQVVIDLGSGDGRILIAAARSHGARGLGVDIDPARVREAQANAEAARVASRVEFRQQDLFETPLAEADVLTLYLTPEVNLRLRPRILSQMRPGTRVVSHDFDMGDWRPDQRQRVGSATIYLWVVPADVEGRWTLRSGGRSAGVEIDQSFQQLTGRVAVPGGGSRIEQGMMNGRRVRFIADIGAGRRVFEGRVEDGRMSGGEGDDAWEAVRQG